MTTDTFTPAPGVRAEGSESPNPTRRIKTWFTFVTTDARGNVVVMQTDDPEAAE